MFGEKDKWILKVHLHIKLSLKALVSFRHEKIIFILMIDLVGQSWEGDIALDDIALTYGYCPPSDECNFEHGLCDGWEFSANGQFNWTIGRNGSTPSGTPTVGA